MKKYDDTVGRAHLLKEAAKEKWSGWKASAEAAGAVSAAETVKETVIKKINGGDDQYDHLYR